MKFYLFAVKFYKGAIFSSKKTFTSFVPWMLTPLNDSIAIPLMFAGERSESLQKSFYMTSAPGMRKLRPSEMTAWMEAQIGEYKTGGIKNVLRIEIVEDLECTVKFKPEGQNGTHYISFKGKPKYMRDFSLTLDSELSSKYRRMVFILDGDIKIEDFVTDLFDAGKVKQRLALSSKFINFKGK